MAFDLNRFYNELDEHYARHNNEETEQFLKKSMDKAFQDGLVETINTGCPSCIPPLEPNWSYVSVCNETACFYRGLSRFQESLDTFSLAQKELETLYLQDTPRYATILLNKAGTYRYMGDLDNALKCFQQAAVILEKDEQHQRDSLAGLYNNMGLVYLDLKEPEMAIQYFEKAMALIEDDAEKIVEIGSTWNNMAAAYQALGKQQEANEAVNRAIFILEKLDCGSNPHYPAALNTRGTLHYQQGEYEAALADFKQALEKTKLVYGENIEYAYACENCAAVCAKLGRTEEASQWKQKGKDCLDAVHK